MIRTGYVIYDGEKLNLEEADLDDLGWLACEQEVWASVEEGMVHWPPQRRDRLHVVKIVWEEIR